MTDARLVELFKLDAASLVERACLDGVPWPPQPPPESGYYWMRRGELSEWFVGWWHADSRIYGDTPSGVCCIAYDPCLEFGPKLTPPEGK